jgi:lysyl-tRNA synthetase class 2
VIGIAAIGTWMTVKDARDFVPRWRDTASWSMGLHRRAFELRPTRRTSWAPRVIGSLVMLAGLANIVVAIRPEFSTRVHAVNTFVSESTRASAHATALPLGLLLIVTGTYLARRRRGAWMIAIALLIASGPIAVIHHDVDGAAIAWLLAFTLGVTGTAFSVRRDPRALRAALARVPLIAILAVLTTVGTILAAYRHVAPHLTAPLVIRETVDLMTFQTGPLHFDARVAWVPLGVALVTAAALIAAAAPILRPLTHPRQPATGMLRNRAHRLVTRYGADSLSALTLGDDVHHLFSPDRRAFLGYRIQRGVLVVSGDPVGPPDAIRDLVIELFRHAERHGLRVAVIGASAPLADTFREAGMRATYIGDEAIVRSAAFTLNGQAMRTIRESVESVVNDGYHSESLRVATLAADTVAELDRLLQGSGTTSAPGSRVVVARDRSNIARGIAILAPCADESTLALTHLHVDPTTPSALKDFLVCEAIVTAQRAGVAYLSLNFIPFGTPLESPQTPTHHLLGIMLRRIHRAPSAARAQRFNARFLPEWTPRYMMSESWHATPRAALAVLELEGHLPRWMSRRASRHSVGQTPAPASAERS